MCVSLGCRIVGSLGVSTISLSLVLVPMCRAIVLFLCIAVLVLLVSLVQYALVCGVGWLLIVFLVVCSSVSVVKRRYSWATVWVRRALARR